MIMNNAVHDQGMSRGRHCANRGCHLPPKCDTCTLHS